MASRRRIPTGLLAPLLAPPALFLDALRGRHLLAPVDGFYHYLPKHILAARAWRHLQVPAWNPWAFSGYPLLASSQTGVLYPPNALFLVLSPVLANNVTVVLDFVLAGAGAYLLARYLCRDEVGAAVAGAGFGLCGFFFGHIGHQDMIASVAWLPWALYGYELLRSRFTPLRLLLAGGALGLGMLAGHGQMFFLELLAVGVYGLTLTVLEWRRERARPLLFAIAVLVVGVGVGAAQLLPTAAVLHATDRSKLSYADATSYSFDKTHLTLVAFPYLFGNPAAWGPFSTTYRGKWNLTEMSGYPGMAALVLAAAGLLAAARRDRRVLALLVLAATGVVMSLGGSTPLGRVVYRVPVYGQFRSWARYLVLFDLVVALLAGYGVAALRSAPAAIRRRLVIVVGASTAAVAVGALVAPHVGNVDHYAVHGSPRQWALWLPVAFAALGAVVAAVMALAPRARWRRVAAVALAPIVALDLMLSFGAFFSWRNTNAEVTGLSNELSRRTTPAWGGVADAPGGIDRYLYASADAGAVPTYIDTTDVKDLRGANGFDPLGPRDYMQAVGGMAYFGVMSHPDQVWEPGSHILDLLRVTTVLVHPPSTTPPIPADSLLDGPTPLPGTKIVRYEHRPALADAFLVGATETRPRAEVLSRLAGRDAGFDPGAVVLADRGCSRCPDGSQPGPAGAVGAERWTTGSVHVEVRAERAAVLVVSQAWFPGWHATVDGHAAPVVRADGLVLGVPVPAGNHHVVLRYRAPGFTAGVALSVLTVLGLLVSAVVVRRRRRISSPATSPGPAA